MSEKACKLLREVDEYFNNEIVDGTKFDKSNLFIYKCPYENKKFRGCKNNNERISALGGHLYEQLAKIANEFKGEGDNGNRHIEIFMMWLSNKLYKLEENKIKTLEVFYKEHLEKHTGNYKYWNLLNSKKEYKRANVWYMSELYSLLKYICDLVNEYNNNPKNLSREIGIISNKCHQKFKTIYNDIKDCYSYFHLLKYLKSIYDGVRNAAVSAQKKPPRGNRLLGYLMNASLVPIVELTTINWNKRFPNQSDKILDFHTNECVKLYSEYVKKQKELELKKTPKAEPQTGSNQLGTEGNKNSLDRSKHTKPEQSKKPTNPVTPKKKGRQAQEKRVQVKHKKKEQGPKPAPPEKKTLPPESPTQLPQQKPPPQPTLELPPPPPQQQGPLSQQESPPQTNPLTTNPPPQNGSSSQTSQMGGLNNQNESKDSGNDKGSTGGTNNNTEGSVSGNENPDGGSRDPASTTSGGSFNLGTSIFKMILKGKEYYNKASEYIEKNKEGFKNVKDKISNAYDNAVNKLKSAYSVSNSYFSEFINNVTSQLNQFGSPSESGDKQSEPGTPINGGKQSNQSPSTNLPSPSMPIPSKDSPLPPLKDPSPTPPQTPSSIPSPQKQPFSQSQSITQNPTQLDPPNHKANIQLVKLPIFNLNLKKTCNIFPTTWNGSEECKPEINFMNTTLVCCTSEQCSLTGISVTLVLIPIILLIVYKYLSREWTKTSEKKNMKRVIKLADGKRKTQIIINSYDRNKDLKPIINSAGRKKDPLLNIYKLMQADPIPFINLFFLLIFFVYKRKSDFLEL
ncbi:hypothetical protein YYE_03998 [Plasmodium vinckei vinckei]|uniref:PIR protein CIR protein n=1 Tax=Plasmodium vinckei vinckei TaxID=54757 RepID=A0A081IBA7_PLAVN|nr:hypothetical protein YYE_03998 [Plasmodium vinckei vinckei]